MKQIKLIIVLLLICLFCLPTTGEKRPKRKSKKELLNPKSRSYVPIPYPKNRQEIIVDLHYYIKRDFKASDELYKHYAPGHIPLPDAAFLELFQPQSKYKIGEIIKIRNRAAELADDYTWLILIMDGNGNIAVRIAMLASGRMASVSAIDPKNAPLGRHLVQEDFRKPTHYKDVKNILSESLGSVVEDQEIKKMERVAYFSKLGSFSQPLWEITMTDDTIYYYSKGRDMIYGIKMKLPWKKDILGLRKSRSEMAQNRDYLPDTVNDEFVILKKIPRKNKD